MGELKKGRRVGFLSAGVARGTMRRSYQCLTLVAFCWIGVVGGGFAESQAVPDAVDFRRQIESLLQDGRIEEAWRSAERAWKLYRRDPATISFLAQVALSTGHLEEATRWAEEALRSGEVGAEIFLPWARWALLRGEVRQPRRFLDLVPPDRRSAEWWFLKSKEAFFSGRTTAATAAAVRAVGENPGEPEYRSWYSVLLEIEGNLLAAAGEMLEVVRAGKARGSDLLRLAELELRLKRWSRAAEVAELAVRRDRENPRAWRLLAAAFRELGEEATAVEAEATAAELERAFAALQEALGLLGRGSDAEAAQRLELLLQQRPDFVPGLLVLARALGNTGRERRALDLYRRILRIDPSQGEAREQAAWLLVKLGDPAGAWELLAEREFTAERREPDNAPGGRAAFWASVAAVRAEDLGAWSDALAAWRAVAERYPADAAVARRVADNLRRQGRFEEALQWLERAYQAEPWEEDLLQEAREIRFAFALRRIEEGRLEAAEKELRRLLEEDPSKPDYSYHLGYVALQRGEWEQALERFLAGGDLSSAPEWVVKNAALCLYSLGRYGEAGALWRRLYEHGGGPEAAYNLGLCLLREGAVEDGWTWVRRSARAGFAPAQSMLRLYRGPEE